MIKKKMPAVLFLALLFSMTAGMQTINLASADSSDPFELPAITITRDGTIDTQNAPIQHIGDTYIVTGNIAGYCLKVERSNVTIDGAGYTLEGKGGW
jgi:hypothetical protein